jgi:FAD synthase
MHKLILGDDFHFGKNRQGNSEFLRDYGFQVTNLDTIELMVNVSVQPVFVRFCRR